ncbi:hypothetical protein SARC_02854 [Sphaeroforma arctica JP610]|uniref:Uncharacterized protein n=1 Tax=Sphaeroforma arctica JP610 TaxID=667725 RepID=A0A0L0G7R5_9EUKA|nr:hypothetical protein SARC_02854 [Sphaeroforma arctica JP610]KNC84931.1 hypothetical protein SARC_02854 [Sphaeroforma arctica JP610]|eukprot:XP_014158833.1 hypothetical protein SARC_02854 [Sphaeroforma arctica JP610]
MSVSIALLQADHVAESGPRPKTGHQRTSIIAQWSMGVIRRPIDLPTGHGYHRWYGHIPSPGQGDRYLPIPSNDWKVPNSIRDASRRIRGKAGSETPTTHEQAPITNERTDTH